MEDVKLLRLPVFLALTFVAAAGLRAQPASATFRPTLADEFSAGFTYSGKGDLSRGDTAAGEVAISRFDLSVAGRVPLGQAMVFIPGLAYSHTSLDASAGTFLPGSLQEFTLSLGLRGFVSKEWGYIAALQSLRRQELQRPTLPRRVLRPQSRSLLDLRRHRQCLQ
jgi:hypothetical protein